MRGLVLVSHSEDIVKGLHALLKEITKETPITLGGGLEDGLIGTTFDRVLKAVEDNPADEVYIFYDLGSAKMNIEMVMEASSKTIHLIHAALVEGCFVAATLIEAGVEHEKIMKQLEPLIVK
jgi:phosphoenolpyruvate---glycerone phosphotransferase subunit DhaM